MSLQDSQDAKHCKVFQKANFAACVILFTFKIAAVTLLHHNTHAETKCFLMEIVNFRKKVEILRKNYSFPIHNVNTD